MYMFPVVLLVGVVLAVFWVYQFTFLMALDDSMFSAKHDKVLWCAAFILAAGLTPFAFLTWRRVKSSESK